MEYQIFQFDSTALVFAIVKGTAVMTMVPADMTDRICDEKMSGVNPFGEERAESCVQVAVENDVYPREFSAGKTHRNMALSSRWGVPEFDFRKGERTELIATYRTEDGLIARQYFTGERDTNVISTRFEVENSSDKQVVLESVPTFILSRLSPFVRYNDETELIVHKLRSYWSAEGVLDSQPAAYHMLEDSWSGLGFRLDKIGQLGSMPANGYLPWIAVEDKTNGCTWAVQLEAPASWQIEIANVYNAVSVCGGLADFTYGHWKKHLKKGQTFCTHWAHIAVCKGNVEQAAQSLVGFTEKRERVLPSEEALPVIYNEYCYTWGSPRMEIVKRLLPVCKQLGVSYFVVDCGWYRIPGRHWDAVGDWQVNREYFPDGLKSYADLCREYGMRAGIWMEFENASADTAIVREHPDWLLTLNGKPIWHGDRTMLDFRKEEVRAHLRKKVTDMLLETGIRYLKIDYNESIGLGVDGADSPGEGLREHTEAVQAFYRSLREDIPDLVIEVCSSGGMRHEPTWISYGNMCSFSDAHEGAEGAVIACNLHRFISPRKLQVWATVRDDYGENETYFTLVKSMLGRVCLSGNLCEREECIMDIIRSSLAFYEDIKPIVREGETTQIHSENITGLRNIHGIQTLTRYSANRKQLLWYCFIIGKPYAAASVTLPQGYRVKKTFGNLQVDGWEGALTATAGNTNMAACVVLAEKA